MSASLLALCVAAAALVAISVSGATALSMLPLRRALDAITPAAQARVLLLLALLPLIACAAVMTAALAPSFGWIADHCETLREIHTHHPHICDHHERRLPAISLLVVAAAFVLRVLFGALALCVQVVRSESTRRALDRSATDEALDRSATDEALARSATDEALARSATNDALARVLPLAAPQAFVLGLWRPTLYVTRGLLSAAHSAHLSAVLAHERAHVRRADPLRMLLANAGLTLHLPGIAGALRHQLLRAQEMAADQDAARELGSRERVATALLALSRAQHRVPKLALAFGACNVHARIEHLLDERARGDAPASSTLLCALCAALLAIAVHASAVHHAVERLLGVLGG